LSQEVTQTIEFVAPSITSLDVSCVATENSVEFQWPASPDITAFIPGIISGQTTGVSTSPTSYLVTGLTPGEVVNIQILAFFANGPCSVGTFTASCTAIDCPSVTATLGTVDPICAGTPATIELSITGDAGPFDIVYELDGLANTVMGAGALTDIALNPTQTASFAITSIINTNAPDCSIDLPAAVAIQVDQLLVAGTAQAVDPICENDGSAVFDLNGLLDGADVGGQWLEISASTGSAFDATAGTFDPSLQTPGIYTFVYTQNTGGACPEASATVSIEIGAVPVADAGEDIDLGCDLNTATIGTNNSTQGGTISYQWTTADGGTIPDPSELLNEVEAAGTYILTVLDEATGCAATDEVIITSSNATVEVFATASAASCLASNGGSIQVDSLSGGTGPYLFSLNGQAFTTDSTFLGLTAGAYELIAADINGCQASAMLNVDAPKELIATLSANDGSLEPLVNLGDSLRLRISLTDESATIDTIIWSPAISACANCENPVITPFISSEYAATVITTDGCSATASINIFVAESDRIFIPNAFSPNDDGFNDVFFINAAPEVIAIKEMQIMDRWGNQVFEASDVPANDPFYGWNGSFRGQRMQPGVFVYYVELELAGGISVVKAGELNLLF
ncbi:MAG: gliding motility-associated C-terminal domain-containing protein, partial [Bacteroidota bacterium]